MTDLSESRSEEKLYELVYGTETPSRGQQELLGEVLQDVAIRIRLSYSFK